MKNIPLDSPEITWAGAVSVERKDGWFRPWRIPFEQYELFPPDGIGGKAGNATGVRITFLSDMRSVELAFEPMSFNEKGNRIDLVCDNELVESAETLEGADRVRFDNIPAGMKRVEIWLAIDKIYVRELSVDEGAKVERFIDERPRWTTYGSSITECRAAHSPSLAWPAIVARELDLNLTCLGFGGNCHAEPMVAMMIRDIPADLITLSIGINVHGGGSLGGRSFLPALIGFVRIIREKQPDIPIIMVSPIISPDRENRASSAGLSLVDMRELNAQAVDILDRHGAGPIFYADGLKVMGEKELDLLPDGVHPNAEGYCRYAENYLREVMPLVQLPKQSRHIA